MEDDIANLELYDDKIIALFQEAEEEENGEQENEDVEKLKKLQKSLKPMATDQTTIHSWLNSN
ncbi:hypothetical protein Plhal304r1_c018g0065721 [Plasmopara halstedii]